MFCINCGKKLEDSAMFCVHCGAPVENGQQNTPTQEIITEQPKKEKVSAKSLKRNKKTIFIVAGIIMVCLLAGGITGYIIYQSHIMKQADNVMSYLSDDEYDEALDLYEKYHGKKKDFDNKVSESLLNIIIQTKIEYLTEDIDYFTAIDQISFIAEFNIDTVNDSLSEVSTFINKVDISRDNFLEGENLYDNGEYLAAIDRFNLVIKEDVKYYELAQKQIEHIEQEETERQRIQQLNDIRDQALEDAALYVDELNYEEAIHVIEQGLLLIPGDLELTNQLDEITNQLSTYNELKETLVKVPSFTSDKYEYTYKENEIDIMNVSIEVPILEGNNPSYETINQTFEYAKEYYINECDKTAEDARLYAYEEYFYIYSYDISPNILYNNNGVLCVALEGYIYTGGAHGYPTRDVYTFDLSTGSIIGLSDLILIEDEELASFITEEFQRMYDEAPEEYWIEAPSTVETDSADLVNFNFYITEDYVCIFYFPYELGSYARGFVEIIIPFENNEWAFSILQ